MMDALSSDAILALGSVGFIFFYAYVHTESLFLTIAGLLGVLMSFPVTLLLHTYIYGESMSFLNGISIWIILGIGADDIFVFYDTWKQLPQYDLNERQVPYKLRLAATYRKAGSAMFATSITTATAFFGSVVSDIDSIREFGFFMGALVTINFFTVLTFFPAILMIYKKYISHISELFVNVVQHVFIEIKKIEYLKIQITL